MHSRICHEVGPSCYWAPTTPSAQSCCYNIPNSMLFPSLLLLMYPAELFLRATVSGRPSDCMHCHRLRPLCTSTSPVPHPRPTPLPNKESRALRMTCQVRYPKGHLRNAGEIFNPPTTTSLSLLIAALTCHSFLVWQRQACKQRNKSTHPTVSTAQRTNTRMYEFMSYLLPLNT